MGQKIENKTAAKKGTQITHISPHPQSHPPSTMPPLKYTKDDEGNFICTHDACKFKSRNQSTAHYHMKKHLEEKNYVCKKCSKGFLQKQTLDLHIRSKHPELLRDSDSDDKKFKCPYDNCEFSSLTKGNTVIHCLRIHFQDEIRNMMIQDSDTKSIECSECCCEFNSSCAFFYHAKKCMTLDATNQKHQMLQEIIA